MYVVRVNVDITIIFLHYILHYFFQGGTIVVCVEGINFAVTTIIQIKKAGKDLSLNHFK